MPLAFELVEGRLRNPTAIITTGLHKEQGLARIKNGAPVLSRTPFKTWRRKRNAQPVLPGCEEGSRSKLDLVAVAAAGVVDQAHKFGAGFRVLAEAAQHGAGDHAGVGFLDAAHH